MAAGHIPAYMIPAFEKAGVDARRLLYAVHLDMQPDGSVCDAYCALDTQTLYVLYGSEAVVKVGGERRIVAEYAIDRLETYALAELREPECEKLLTTARLWARVGGENPQRGGGGHAGSAAQAGGAGNGQAGSNGQAPSGSQEPCEAQAHGEAQAQAADNGGGEPRVILLFSIGYLPYAERLAKAMRNIAAGVDPLREVSADEELFCPVCGSRYPERDRKVCPKCIDRLSIGRRLMGFFKDYRKQVAQIIAVMLLGTAFSILSPYVGSKLLFDEVLTEGGRYYGAIAGMTLLIFAVRFIGVALNVLYTYVLAKTVPWIVYDLKIKIFEAMQRLSVNFYTSKRTGQLMNRVIRDATNIYWFFVDGLPFVVVNALTFAGVLALMCMLNLKLAAVCLVIVPIAIAMFRVLWGVFKRYHHKDWVYSSQLNSMVSDSVNGQRVIKAFAREDEEAGRFAGVGRKQADVDIVSINTEFTAFPLIYLFMFFGQVIITAIGGVMVLDNEISLGTLLTFIAYLSMLYGPLEFMSWVSNWWARCVDSAQRVFEIIDAKPDVGEPDDPAAISDIRGGVDIRGVWFEYEPATPILRGLDLSVGAGSLLGV
ncbi:MAG: hypothetical protein LBJ10_06140, partial [Clostridiales bacterium]|nr:hypothetical protein [Clostridiales bacterium]